MVKTLRRFSKKTDLKLSDHYKLKRSLSKGHVWFKSDCGEIYRCIFTQSKSSNDVHGMITTYPVFALYVVRAFKVSKPRYDQKVSKTISIVMNNFFIKNKDAIISYVCDDTDSKGLYRYITFQKWFNSCSLKPKKFMVSTGILGTAYFGAIMLQENHERQRIVDYLKSEMADFENTKKEILFSELN